MKIIPFTQLACPIDGIPLSSSGSSWVCENGHNFDVAKKGYINLLPVQQKRSLDPGDHKEMVACRQRFLNAGYYQPIAKVVNQAVLQVALQNSSPEETISCLDAGCGEGYYLRELAAENSEATLSLLGLDISKWAVLAAAKQDKRPCWLVGSNASLPVQSNTVDCVLSMFGFPVYGEFSRVLKPGGVLLKVDSGADHLQELRDIIYPTLKEKRDTKEKIPEGFSLLGTDTVRYSLSLENAQSIADLLSMTPHFYRASAEGRVKAAALTELTVTIDVQLSTLMCNKRISC